MASYGAQSSLFVKLLNVGRSAPTTATPAPQPQEQPETSTAAPAVVATTPTRENNVVQWTEVQQERARALFAKYGLTLEAHEWMTPQNLEVRRVDKPIRMRVRRTCHRCQTTFGPDRVCVNCQHVRCKQCPRYPQARTKEEKEARALAKAQVQPDMSSEAAAAAALDSSRQKYTLTIPAPVGAQDLYKRAKQHMRRSCHRCQTPFPETPILCENCGHNRCQLCPRVPYVIPTAPCNTSD